MNFFIRLIKSDNSRYMAWVLPLVVFLVIAVITSNVYIVNLVTDDALYYPVVARSIALGNGSSYDGITQTNGYHPLWCWLQVPIAALTVRLEPLQYLWFIKLLMSITVLLALVIWEHVTRRISGSVWFSSVILLMLGSYWWSIYTLYSGMETPLVIFLMGLSLMLADRLLSSHSLTYSLTLGLVMAATFLARLDTIFFLGVLGVFVLIGLRSNLRLIGAWVFPIVVMPLPYLWWNKANFGSIVPVSGLKKTAFDFDLSQQSSIITHFWGDKLNKLVEFLHPAGLFAVLAICAVLIYLARHEVLDYSRRLGILWIVPISALLHYGYASVFMSEADIYWYQYGEYLTAFLLLAVFVSAAAAWLLGHLKFTAVEWLPFTLILTGVLSVLVLYVPKKLPNPTSLQVFQTALWAKANMDAGSELRFGMIDSGIFRFVSGFKTISLNGLAGDREILRLVQQSNWSEIINDYQLDYIVNFFPTDDISQIPFDLVVYQSDPFVYVNPGRMLIVDSKYWIMPR